MACTWNPSPRLTGWETFSLLGDFNICSDAFEEVQVNRAYLSRSHFQNSDKDLGLQIELEYKFY